MSHPITNRPAVQEHQVLVKTAIKGDVGIFKYSAVDTIRTLNEKIRESEGIPAMQQRLYATYDYTKCWQTQELDDSDALLIDRLQHVSYVTVALKLRQD